MAERDRAAIDVDLFDIPTEVLVDGAGLGRERLIGLDQVEVLELPAGFGERGTRGRDADRPPARSDAVALNLPGAVAESWKV